MAELPKLTRPDFGGNPVVFLKEVRAELYKVSWPTRDQVIKLTIVVVAVSLAIGLYIGGLDLILTQLTNILLVRK